LRRFARVIVHRAIVRHGKTPASGAGARLRQ
jgi:hypothetical protein